MAKYAIEHVKMCCYRRKLSHVEIVVMLMGSASYGCHEIPLKICFCLETAMHVPLYAWTFAVFSVMLQFCLQMTVVKSTIIMLTVLVVLVINTM